MSTQYNAVLPLGLDRPGPINYKNDVDASFVLEVNELLKAYIAAMDSAKIRLGSQTALALSTRRNAYLQASKIGRFLLQNAPARCGQVVVRAANLVYVLAVLVEPFIPSIAAEILKQLNAPQRTVPHVFSIDLLPGHTIDVPKHLFSRIDEKQAEIWRSEPQESG
jgi:methionyl-tRNA synthetase